MTPQHLQFHSHSPQETEHLAAVLAPLLVPGDTVLLDGPIGSGKSHFTRAAILNRLSTPEDIPSPTYTIVQTYQTPEVEIWHADLYRLGDPSEVHEIGLWAAFDDAICFVEWPDRLGTQAPASALTISFAPHDTEDSRVLTFSWSDPKWAERLKGAFGD